MASPTSFVAWQRYLGLGCRGQPSMWTTVGSPPLTRETEADVWHVLEGWSQAADEERVVLPEGEMPVGERVES